VSQNRVFFAVQSVGFAPHGVGSGIQPSGFNVAHGVQSVQIATQFNLEQVFELGQLELYESIEAIPDIEVQVSKVLDGYPLLYHLATPTASSPSLVGRSNERCFMALNIYPDTQDNASGTPLSSVGMSGLYLSSLTYTLPVEGSATEQVTLVGNDKVWKGVSGYQFFQPNFDGTDQPLAIIGSGGVQRREDVLMGEGEVHSTFPTFIPGITSSGTNPEVAGGGHAAHLQTITISANLGREQLFELGTRAPYHRFVRFPLEVTCSIAMTAADGDRIDALADPVGGSNLSNETIVIKMREGTVIDLGSKNKLASVTYGGGDATGGNVAIQYTLKNYNTLTPKNPQDPAGLYP
jgi:hypothetical protein